MFSYFIFILKHRLKTTNNIRYLYFYKSMMFSWSWRFINHMGYENNPTTGSSGEFWAMY